MATFFAVGISHCLFADDRLNMPKAMGCVLGFVGVLIITLSSLDGLSGGVSLTGEGFMFLAAAASGSGAVISKFAAKGQSPMVVTGWQLTIGGAVLLLAGIVGGGHFQTVSPQAFCLLGYLFFSLPRHLPFGRCCSSAIRSGKVSVYNFSGAGVWIRCGPGCRAR